MVELYFQIFKCLAYFFRACCWLNYFSGRHIGWGRRCYTDRLGHSGKLKWCEWEQILNIQRKLRSSIWNGNFQVHVLREVAGLAQEKLGVSVRVHCVNQCDLSLDRIDTVNDIFLCHWPRSMTILLTWFMDKCHWLSCQWHLSISSHRGMSIRKMSLTSQWHFQKKCHWPNNDTFWGVIKSVIDQSMTVSKSPQSNFFETLEKCHWLVNDSF